MVISIFATHYLNIEITPVVPPITPARKNFKLDSTLL